MYNVSELFEDYLEKRAEISADIIGSSKINDRKNIKYHEMYEMKDNEIIIFFLNIKSYKESCFFSNTGLHIRRKIKNTKEFELNHISYQDINSLELILTDQSSYNIIWKVNGYEIHKLFIFKKDYIAFKEFHDAMVKSFFGSTITDNEEEKVYDYNGQYTYNFSRNFLKTLEDGIRKYIFKELKFQNLDQEIIQKLLGGNNVQLEKDELTVFLLNNKKVQDSAILFTNNRIIYSLTDEKKGNTVNGIAEYSANSNIRIKSVAKVNGMDAFIWIDDNPYWLGIITNDELSMLTVYLKLVLNREFLFYYCEHDIKKRRYSEEFIKYFFQTIILLVQTTRPSSWSKKLNIKLWKKLKNPNELLNYEDFGIFAKTNKIIITKTSATWEIGKQVIDLFKYNEISFQENGKSLPSFGVGRALPMERTDVFLDGDEIDYMINMDETDRFILQLLLLRGIKEN